MKTCTDSSSHPHEVDLSGDDSARLRSRGRSRSQAHGDHQIDSFQRPGTLLIDDEPQIGRLVAHALSVAGCSVAIERSGAAGIAAASTGAFMVVLIDIRLPDMSGLDVLRALRRITPHARLIILSGYLSIEVAVEAMKLGACDAVQKPLSGERLREVVRLAMTPPPPSVLDVRPVPAPAGTGSSVSERWAMLALKACRAERDLKTIADWARIGGVSYSSLCEMCRLVRMRPHEARDLVRMLRAIIMAARFQCPFQLLLDVADRRTLDHLLRKSGLDEAKGVTPTLEHIFESQEFVARNAEGLKLLRRLLTMPEHR